MDYLFLCLAIASCGLIFSVSRLWGSPCAPQTVNGPAELLGAARVSLSPVFMLISHCGNLTPHVYYNCGLHVREAKAQSFYIFPLGDSLTLTGPLG